FPPRFQATVLANFTKDMWREILTIVDEWSEDPTTVWGGHAAKLLGSFSGDPERTLTAVRRLEKLVATPDDDVSYEVGQTLETLLRAASPTSPVRNSVLDLARACIPHLRRAGRACIIYYAAHDLDHDNIDPQKNGLLLDLLRTETDE